MSLGLRRRAGVAATTALLAILVPLGAGATAAADPTGRSVDPFIGTGGPPPWHSGNTNPAATRPFGMVQLGPDTTATAAGTPSEGAAGYRATDTLVRGFSSTHVSGAGCRAFGDVPLLPIVGPLPARPSAATVGLVKSSERASPGRYGVRLTNGVAVSMAAGLRSGVMRFAYAGRRPARLLVKADGSLAGTSSARVRFVGRREIAVAVSSGRFCDAPNRYRVHVVLRFDRPFRAHGAWRGGAWVAAGGRDRVLRVQVGVSFVSAAGARANLRADRSGFSVLRLAARATSEWRRELGRVAVSGGTPTTRRLFDTALYRVLQHPSTISDADGRYPGADGRVHRVRAGERQLSNISGWDFYRTHAPLLAWLRPDVGSQAARSLLRFALESGRLPRWPMVAGETGIMNGDSAAPTLAALHAFGARDFDLATAVRLLDRQGSVVRDEHGYEPRPGLGDYLRRGYVPDPVLERGRARSHGASTTLEYAVDDFAVSRLARAAGNTSVERRFLARSGAWRALVDPARGQLVPRDATGALPAPDVDATACCVGFEEGNPLQYTWGGVPQDVAGLLTALGSPAEVAGRLDAFFSQLNVGGGPNAWLGNEPSFATPWTYHWLGLPARTADVVARARAELWSARPDGLPGNDDLGALSAWYVWSSLGLYPFTPGTADVAVGLPAFDTATVRPSRGASTVITRSGTGPHVGAVHVDGAGRSRSWLALSPGRTPRRVAVAGTADASPAWGTGSADVPPSYPANPPTR